jgi:anti-sigma regulatory factor (Ser/Thr protein kinase)
MACNVCGESGGMLEFHEDSPTLRTAQAVRRWAEPFLESMPLEGDVSDALLVLSELVTNAVEHAPGPLCVQLHETSERLCIAVEDTDPPVPTSTRDGLGLLLVSRLASPYAVTRTATGKAVKVTMALTRRLAASC